MVRLLKKTTGDCNQLGLKSLAPKAWPLWPDGKKMRYNAHSPYWTQTTHLERLDPSHMVIVLASELHQNLINIELAALPALKDQLRWWLQT